VTSQPANVRFDPHSILGIGASMAAGVVAALVCYYLLHAPPIVGPVTAGATGLPAAIAYSLQSRRRDNAEDAARIRRGVLHRPVRLVVVMLTSVLAAALLLLQSTRGGVVEAILAIHAGAAKAVVFWVPASLIVLAAMFFVASFASHYLGKHPYRWTTVAVGAAVAISILLCIALNKWLGIDVPPGRRLRDLPPVVDYLIHVGVCLGGAWYGRRHHDTYLAKKLARVESKLPEAADVAQPSGTRHQSTASSDDTPPQATPPTAIGLEELEELEKLSELRKTGVLTEREFTANKAEVLAGLRARDEPKRLAELRKTGELTDEEFTASKAGILAGLRALDELNTLVALHNAHVLGENEFQAKKAQILPRV
jgi:hypothetical protein